MCSSTSASNPSAATRWAPDQASRDLGWMLHDIDYDRGRSSHFFRARLDAGVLDVARCLAEGIAS